MRGKAWQALGSEVENETIHKALLSKLQDTQAPEVERCGALLGLAQEAGKDPVRRYVVEFYENPKTRVPAMEAMRNSFDRSFGSYFPPHLDDEDPEVRREAIYGIGYLGVTERAEDLRKFFDDDEYRSDALFAFALSTRAEISRGRIKALFRKIEDLAGGFADEEVEIVQLALDERLLSARSEARLLSRRRRGCSIDPSSARRPRSAATTRAPAAAARSTRSAAAHKQQVS